MNIRLISGGVLPYAERRQGTLILVSTPSMEGGQRRKGVIPRG